MKNPNVKQIASAAMLAYIAMDESEQMMVRKLFEVSLGPNANKADGVDYLQQAIMASLLKLSPDRFQPASGSASGSQNKLHSSLEVLFGSLDEREWSEIIENIAEASGLTSGRKDWYVRL